MDLGDDVGIVENFEAIGMHIDLSKKRLKREAPVSLPKLLTFVFSCCRVWSKAKQLSEENTSLEDVELTLGDQETGWDWERLPVWMCDAVRRHYATVRLTLGAPLRK